MTRRALQAVFLFALIIAGFLGAERVMVYPLDPRVVDPASLGLDLKAERVTTASGAKVMLWSAPPLPDRPTVFYLHGNAGNLANRAPRFRVLRRNGFGIIAPAYPGSSGTPGWPHERAILERIAAIYAERPEGPLLVYGESIGAAVALQLATRPEWAANPPDGLLLEAPFTSLEDVAEALSPALKFFTGLMLSRWRSLQVAPEIELPLLVIHGAGDRLIPLAQGRAIYDAAGSEAKLFVEMPQAGHTDLWQAETQRRLMRWMLDRAR